MKTICKVVFNFNRNSEFQWQLSPWYSYDGGKTFESYGECAYFKNAGEYAEAIMAYNKAHSTPFRAFPLITKEIQQRYEKDRLKGRVICAGIPFGSCLSDDVPCICGYHGRACWQMDKAEGANRGNCMSCPLAEYAHAMELMAWAES